MKGYVIIYTKRLWFLLILFNNHLCAQEMSYTLNQFNPLSYQPATPVLDGNASINFLTERYRIGPGIFASSNKVNAELPITSNKGLSRYLGIGLNFSEKDYSSSDLLKTHNAGLSIATSIQVSSSHTIGFGLSGDYVSKRTSLENVSTGEQWIQNEFRYDPSANLGETFTRQNINYFSLASGIIWEWYETERKKAFASISAFNLNRPIETFFQNGIQLKPVYMLSLGTTVLRNNRFEFTPQVNYWTDGFRNNYQILGSVNYSFNNSNPYDVIQSGALELLANYGKSGDMGIGLVLHQPNYRLGSSFQFPLIASQAYFQHSFQLGISISLNRLKQKESRVLDTDPPGRVIKFEDSGPTNINP